MEKSLISIIIPVYNQAKELEKALGSIKKQTYTNLEVIVVDDGSEPPVILSEATGRSEVEESHGSRGSFGSSHSVPYAQDDVRIYRQQNKGAPAARNRGFEMSKGEYVIFWDADVVAEPEMLEKMLKALEEHPEASYSYSDFRFQILRQAPLGVSSGRTQDKFSDFIFYKTIKGAEFNAEALKVNNFIHSTSLIRRKDVVRWDESLKRFQDWDLWLTMLEQDKKGVWIDEFLFKIISKGAMSEWLPSFAYKKPWKYLPWIKSKVERYEEAREVVVRKHFGSGSPTNQD